MRAAFLASILPRVMKEGESMEGSSQFDEKSQFDNTLQYSRKIVKTLSLLNHCLSIVGLVMNTEQVAWWMLL